MIICENMQKYTKIQASVQHGLYLFTCEIHSFNSTSYYLRELVQLPRNRSRVSLGAVMNYGERGGSRQL